MEEVSSPCDVLNMSEGTASRSIGGTCQGLDQRCRPSTGVGGPGGSRTRTGFGRIRRTCRRVVSRHRGRCGSKCNSDSNSNCNDCNPFKKFNNFNSCKCNSTKDANKASKVDRRSTRLGTTTGCVQDKRCGRTLGMLTKVDRRDTE